MRPIIVFFLMCSALSFGQTNRFIYRYEFIPDAHAIDSIRTEYMFLDINPDNSLFYSYQNYVNDSTALEAEKKGLSYMPPNREYLNFRLEKDLNKQEIHMITSVGYKAYDVMQQPSMIWHITNSTAEHLGYEVIKAETDFGGRHWTAWFAPAIPIPDGPYKFSGLPGLIMKAEDSTGSHRFITEQIRLLPGRSEYPRTSTQETPIPLADRQYRKLFADYRRDPLGDMRGNYPDQTDSAGNFRTGAEVFRDTEKAFKERIKRDNNIIELDLLR